MSRDEHPSDEVIEAFAQGRLAVSDASRLESHFESCHACGEKLGRVGVDTYSELIRQQVASESTVHDTRPRDVPPGLYNHSRYTVIRPIGSGGMGVVYEAQHRVMKRRVALKVIRPDLLATPAAVARFRREVHTAARLSHPNIVAALDAEEAGGVHFLVMEYVPGTTLEHRVHDHGPLPSPRACDLARQIALGLAHAHERGMIHRDIKPANVMLTPEGAVKILDFGLAAWADTSSLTQAGVRLGTPLYAAPEQFPTADAADARADQYGLGATLYFLLTGQPPAAGPLSFPGDVPEPVRAIVARLLATDPAKRFPSAEAVARALEPWCDRKPPRLHRRGFAIGAAFALGLAALAIGAAVWMNNARPIPPTRPPVLFLLPSHGLWHEDYGPARKVLEDAGHRVLVATPGGGPSQLHEASLLGKADRPASVAADLDLANVQLHQFDALVCVGADDSEFTDDRVPSYVAAMRLLQGAHKADKWLVGICAGQRVLGTAGLLRGKKVAHPSEYVDNPAGMGAFPQPEAVVLDGRLLTASTSGDSADAGRRLVEALKSIR